MTNSRIGRKKGNIGRRASREAGNSPESVIINKLDVFTTPDRGKKDIPGWKTAIQSAESPIPQRSKLYDLYHDVELHPQVEAVTEKIYDAVASADWVFVDKDGAPVDAINELIDSLGFEDLLTEIVRSKFWHYAMVECRFKKDSDDLWELFTFEIPKKHMRPHLGVAAFSGVGDDGIDIRSKLYPSKILEVGKDKDLGKFAKIAPYVLLANGGIGDFAMVVQNFGEPIIDAVWDGMDENARQLLISAIKSRGPGGAIVRPTGTDLDMLEMVNCTGELQKTFIDICLKLISKGLLGTTETTDSSTSSGYAQAQTHQDQDEKKYARFIRFVRRVLNSRFKKILKANGFDTKGGKFIIKGEAEKIALKDLVEILVKLHKEFKLPVDDDFLYEKFGITKPEQYDELKAELLKHGVDPNPVPDPNNPKPVPAPNDDPDDDPEDDLEDEPKRKKANLSWREQAIQLFEGFFGSAPAPDGACCTHHIALSDTQSHEQTQAIAALIQEVYDSQGQLKISVPMLESTADLLLEGFRQGLSSAPRADRVELIDSGFDYGVDDPAIMTAYELNMFRFSAAKNLAEVQELNALFRRASSFNEFEELVQATINNYNRNWMLTEFNTGVNTGEARATYERLLTKTDLFPYWKYVTIGDDKVRHEHALLDELILPWDDTRWAKLFPPNGWNCRCYIVPVMAHELPEGYSLEKSRKRADNFFKSKEFKRQNRQGWGVNRAAIGEVFTANQQYLYKQPGKSSKTLNKLKASDYKLPSYSNLKAQASGDLPEYTGTAAAFFGDLEIIDDHSILRDLRRRQIRVPGQTAEATAIDPDKTRNLQSLQESLINPDEIWINGSANTKIDQYVYIKYYQDEALITVATLDKLELTITDWFTLSDKKLSDYRRGILIKNNTSNVGQ